jgi:hypothetical protein
LQDQIRDTAREVMAIAHAMRVAKLHAWDLAARVESFAARFVTPQ